jgi:dTDP-4-amino-4,6-dideoxygalactose transaminase
MVHYPIPLHQQPAFPLSHWHRVGKVPVSERACLEVLSLPLYPSLTDGAQDQIIDLVNTFVRHSS